MDFSWNNFLGFHRRMMLLDDTKPFVYTKNTSHSAITYFDIPNQNLICKNGSWKISNFISNSPMVQTPNSEQCEYELKDGKIKIPSKRNGIHNLHTYTPIRTLQLLAVIALFIVTFSAKCFSISQKVHYYYYLEIDQQNVKWIIFGLVANSIEMKAFVSLPTFIWEIHCFGLEFLFLVRTFLAKTKTKTQSSLWIMFE